MKSIKLYFYLLFIATISTRCCCDRPPAVNLTAEEEAWLPYHIGDTISFSSTEDTLTYLISDRKFSKTSNKKGNGVCSFSSVNSLFIKGRSAIGNNLAYFDYNIGKRNDSLNISFSEATSWGQYFTNKIDGVEINGRLFNDVYIFESDTSSVNGPFIYKRFFKNGIGLIKFDVFPNSKSYELIF